MREPPDEEGDVPSPLLPSRAREQRWTIARTLARADEVESLLASGYTPRRVAGECAKAWGITRRQAQDYVTAIHERWTQMGQRDRESRRNEMRAKLGEIYRRSVISPSSYKDALKALDLESKLDGLNDDSVAEERAVASVLAVLKLALAPSAYADAALAIAKAAGRDVSAARELPSGSGTDEGSE